MTTAYGLSMQVTTKKVAGVLCLRYTYTTSGRDGVRFNFYTLNEVGEPYKRQARMLRDHVAEQLGMAVRSKELDVKPWVVDALVTPEEAAAMDAEEERKAKEFRIRYLEAKE